MWKKAGVPGENPRVQAGNQHVYSTNVDRGDRTRVAAVINECTLKHSISTCILLFIKRIVFKRNDQV